MLKILEELKEKNLISELNYQFAKFIDQKQQAYNYSERQRDLAVLLAALVSYNVMQGHTALNLTSQLARNPFHSADKISQKIGEIRPLEWQAQLQGHIAFSDDPSHVAPMLFQNGLLYFYRYWQAENRVANYLRQAVSFEEQNANWALDRKILDQLFDDSEASQGQKKAVATALNKRFSLISGGPGTGKTRTVARLLAALQLKQLEQHQPLLRIALAAPTGKAAARLKESISQNLAELTLPTALKDEVPTNASTIHRLLGIRPMQDLPRYHQKNPLPLDLLVVDEASMIDLSLMEKLMNALKPSTRLIMLGDKDQLASVEAGAIMGELGHFLTFGYSSAHCDYLLQVADIPEQAGENTLPICDSLSHLSHSFRFDANSGIGFLAKKVNTQQANEAWRIFQSAPTDLDLVEYLPANDPNFADARQWTQHCVHTVVQKAVELYRDYLTLVKQRTENPQAVSVANIFTAFQKVRFLSALRVGELGVERLNQGIAEALQRAKLVQFRNHHDRYIGKPILITENSPQNQIFSGDIGIILPDEQGAMRVYFDTILEGSHQSISLSRVPNYEPAYIMTVHKSQGSEFAHTLLVMPLTSSPVLTKELIYTAITRAKAKFTLFSNETIWREAVKTKVQRQSGLRLQLENT